MYRITIHEKPFFTDTEEKSHHHFDSAESAIRFLAALERPHKIFVSDVVEGHYWFKSDDATLTTPWQCAECGQYDGVDTHPQCPGNPQVEIDAAYKQLADDMALDSWREANR